MQQRITAGPGSLRVFNTKASAAHDPQALGAILARDPAEDCTRLGASSNAIDVRSCAMIGQAARRYVSRQGRGCLSLWVDNFSQLPSLQATDFGPVARAAASGAQVAALADVDQGGVGQLQGGPGHGAGLVRSLASRRPQDLGRPRNACRAGRSGRKGVGVEPTGHAGRIPPVLKTGRPTGKPCPSLHWLNLSMG